MTPAACGAVAPAVNSRARMGWRHTRPTCWLCSTATAALASPGTPTYKAVEARAKKWSYTANIAALEQDGRGGLLGFYGDHMPSLPGAFAALDFQETDTDYLLWQPGPGQALRRDIAVASVCCVPTQRLQRI